MKQTGRLCRTRQASGRNHPIWDIHYKKKIRIIRVKTPGARENRRTLRTDNKNLILDIQFVPLLIPENENVRIRQIRVLSHGFFFGLAGRVIIGYATELLRLALN